MSQIQQPVAGALQRFGRPDPSIAQVERKGALIDQPSSKPLLDGWSGKTNCLVKFTHRLVGSDPSMGELEA